MSLVKPTPAMCEALQAFADAAGRTWKAVLIWSWEMDRVNAQDHQLAIRVSSDARATALRQVRDLFGATWLRTRCKIQATKRTRPR